MSQQIINRGTAPNDGTGESPFSGIGKINDNFTELYGAPAFTLDPTKLKLTADRLLIANPTDDGTSKLQVNGTIRAGITSIATDGSLSSSGDITFNSVGYMTFNSGLDLNIACADSTGAAGSFNATAGSCIGTGVGGNVSFSAGVSSGLNQSGAGINFYSGAATGTGANPTFVFTDAFSTNAMTFDPITGILKIPSLQFGTYVAGAPAATGYITIKDFAGNTRKLLCA